MPTGCGGRQLPGSCADQLAKCLENLAAYGKDDVERDLNQQLVSTWKDSAGGQPHVPLEQLQEKVRVQKHVFIHAQEQLNFAQAMMDQEQTTQANDPDSVSDIRKAEKAGLKPLKQQLAKELQMHIRLREEIETMQRQYKSAFEQVSTDLQRQLALVQSGEVDLQAKVGDLDDAGLVNRVNTAQKEIADAIRETRLIDQERDELRAKKSSLEAELRQHRAREHEARKRKASFEKDMLRELSLRSAQEKMCESAYMFGLPEHTFDREQGKIVLAMPRVSPSLFECQGAFKAPEVLRTVSVSYDAGGRLASVLAHPSLELRHEAEVAVGKNDIAHVLAAVWDKVIDFKPASAQRGGA